MNTIKALISNFLPNDATTLSLFYDRLIIACLVFTIIGGFAGYLSSIVSDKIDGIKDSVTSKAITNADAKAINATTKAEGATERAEIASARAEKATKRAEEAEARAAKAEKLIQRSKQPRAITKHEAERFIAILKASPKGEYYLSVNSTAAEKVNLATQLNEMLSQAGWESVLAVIKTIDLPCEGIMIETNNKGSLTFQGLYQAFSATSLKVSYQFSKRNVSDDDEIYVVIGDKPDSL